ncbi:tripartite tricarboxylate transporter TctB family protein [Acuticoccus sediminis]|uniref:Tripartite tricarboxylate transporter TctB family protein n=1 Tax=Acuticoccus sediminis TaxID=2184697 RepID=A0A8B2NX41_9HYPH|nr:tripartite tricarboxylate transporter TctB family protein [Acuticoccus sediminis]RAI03230.1 tripartite tricarboxylate transporter TctB family protein [Acuticoccus sediminis]
MVDRLFAGVLFLVALGYTYIAFTAIKAPFQYDPLGPESWPQLLGIVALLCSGYLFARPEVASFGLKLPTWGRLAILVVLLFGYAELFRPAGFIVATFAFCSLLSLMLGARILPALGFGAATGVVGFFLCTRVLELNLPAGVFAAYL